MAGISWQDEFMAAIVSRVSGNVRPYNGSPSVFWTAANEDVRNPFVVIDDPESEYTELSDGYLENISIVLRYYCDRTDTSIITAVDTIEDLTEYFSGGNMPQPTIDGNIIIVEGVDEVPSDKPEEYVLELTMRQVRRV